MASICKSKKTGACVGESQKADRLSTLPRPLLLHILSFLPTKCAVQTTILSRRWEDLWTSLSALDFGDNEEDGDEEEEEEYPCHSPTPSSRSTSRSPSNGGRDIIDVEAVPQDFADFVNRVLILRDGSDLQRFRVCLRVSNWAPCVDRWLCYAVKHWVREIDICFFPKQPYRPPRQLFLCPSLNHMKLHLRGGCLKLPASVGLPNLECLEMTCVEIDPRRLLCHSPKLKILNLETCDLVTDDVFDVSCCSCLESLSLKGRKLVGVKTINVSCPELKSLSIKKSMASWDC